MKLISEYSYPVGDQIRGSFHSYPFFNEKKLLEAMNTFLSQVGQHMTGPGFKATFRLEDD